MTVKVALLKSGEDIIADVKEMVVGEDGNQRVVGYFFNKPCVVNFKKSQDTKTFDIRLFPWIPISRTLEVPVTMDWVITLVDPIIQLENMYKKDVLKEQIDDQSQVDFVDQQLTIS